MGPSLVQTLPKAALIGVLVGVGGALVQSFQARGRWLAISAVAAAALGGIARFYGSKSAVGAFGAALGVLCGSFIMGSPAGASIILGAMGAYLINECSVGALKR